MADKEHLNLYDKVKLLRDGTLGIIVDICEYEDSKFYTVQNGNNYSILAREDIKPINKSVEFKTISLPILNGLDKITLESAILKVFEEGGELSQIIGKQRGLNGEKNTLDNKTVMCRLGEELVDLLQTAVTMADMLKREYNVDVDDYIPPHMNKAIEKGYLE